MTWTCEKCGYRHDTSERVAACRRTERRWRWFGVLILLVAVVAGLAWNQYAYGDWKCAFMRCVKVTQGGR